MAWGYVDQWLPEGLSKYPDGKTALPANRGSSLESDGNVILGTNFSNWFYNGTQNTTIAIMRKAFSDPAQWYGTDGVFDLNTASSASMVVTGFFLFLAVSLAVLL